MSPDKLAYMANQIARFFASQKLEDPAAAVADHLVKFWEPRMRREILAHLEQAQLDPLARAGLERLKAPQGA